MNRHRDHSQPIHLQNLKTPNRFNGLTVLDGATSAPDALQSNAFFQNAHHFNISGNPSFQNQTVTNVYAGGTDDLHNLKGSVSFDALHDSSVQDPTRQCHPGTRRNVLKRLRRWIDDPNFTERIFWLYGPAGAGKSAIAQTIARSYHEGEVAATFFFFRSDSNRNNGNRLFPTIAWQLAFSIPSTRNHIVNFLAKRPHLPRSDIETQFNQLIFQPSLQAAKQIGSPVIIIDGIDECSDESLQRRLLNLIGEAVRDDRFSPRFLVVSRPELHIEQTIRRFRTQILRIDLANLDGVNRDIEKYLVDEFSRIASEQGLSSTWPGKKAIADIIYKSSGNFIFPSLVIRFTGDPDNIAETQLDIVLSIKPPTTTSSFAILDQLFSEILKRVPDQDFLKRYLALLTARISASSDYFDLHKDDAVLMHVSEKELHAKLRRTRSLLKLQPEIDVYHKSFLDFLHDPSRSGQYHIGKQGEIDRYLEFFVDSVVRHISNVIEQPDHHNAIHFAPVFSEFIAWYPPKIDMTPVQWREVTKPLLDLQDKLLSLPNFASTWDILRCDQCTSFDLLRELLYLRLYMGFEPGITYVRKREGVIFSNGTEAQMSTNDDLDGILLSLFARLSKTTEHSIYGPVIFKLMNAVLRFDCVETAKSMRSTSDAQRLIDLLDHMIHAKNGIHPDTMRKASLLALEIFVRVPTVPLSDLHGNHQGWDNYLFKGGILIETLSQTIFANRFLNHPSFEMGTRGLNGLVMSCAKETHFLQRKFVSDLVKIRIMVRLAKHIQHLHSMGFIISRLFGSNDILWDKDLHPRILSPCSTSRYILNKCQGWSSFEDNIFSLGCIFYELHFRVGISPGYSIDARRRVVTKRRSEIPKYIWQLIQRCCSKRPNVRPTIDDVVKEIQSWNSFEDAEDSSR